MKIEKGIISSSQLMLLTLSFIQGAHLAISFVYNITKQDTWISVIAAFVISLLFALVYIALAQKFPGKNLIEIFDCIYGRYLGKLFSILYILFFLSIVSQNLYFFGNFWLTYVLPETPMSAILIMFVFVCAWAVRNGIEVIARCSFLIVVINTVIIIFVTLLLLKDMKFTNLLPVLEFSFKSFVQGTHIVIAIPFCEIIVFLMIIPYVNKIKQAKGSVLLGLTLGAIQLLVIVLRDIAVLGPLKNIAITPPFMAVRQIDIADVMTRLDIVIAIVLLLSTFMKVSIFYYATVLGTAQVLNLKSYVPIITPVGIISISLAMQLFGSSVEQAYNGASIWPVFTVPFEFLIPLLSLLIAAIRGLPKAQRGDRG